MEDIDSLMKQALGKRILIIGDAVVDKYITGSASRISPDAPVPILDVEKKEYYAGGVGLVINYLKGMGGKVDFCTVVGNDFEGDFLRKAFQKADLGLSGLIQAESFTPQVTRVKARGQHLLRLEKKYEITPQLREHLNNDITAFVSGKIAATDVVLLVDYNAGIFSQNANLIRQIIGIAHEQNIMVLGRPEKSNFQLFNGLDFAKININIAASIVGIHSLNETSLRIIGMKLANDIQCRGLYLSYVDGKSYCLERDNFEVISPVLHQHGTSYVGVGSATLAALSLMVGAGMSYINASKVANVAGAMSAIKPPVTYFSLSELQEAVSRGQVDECRT